MAKKRKTPSSAENRATWFMIRVAEGMAAWASFAQATFLSPVYSEALTYRPIFEITRPRDWKPLPQKKLAKREGRAGRNQTVDFAFQSKDKKIGIFLEVKFVRKKQNHCIQASKDIHKLALLDESDISEKNPPASVYKYILLLGTKRDIETRISAFAKKLKDGELAKLAYTEDLSLVTQVRSAFEDSDREAKGRYAWAFPGLGNDKWKYWSVLLKEKKWWKKLGELSGELPEGGEDETTDDAARIADDAEGEFDA